MTWGRRVAFAR